MATKTLLGSEVKRLLSNLSGSGTRHLSEIEMDLAQTNILLEEAIEKLSAGFMAIHDAVRAQQQTVDSLLLGAMPGAAEALKARQEEIGLHVNAAITGLQFQDMTSQLLGRTARRVTGLCDLLNGLGESGAAMPAGSSEDDVAERLARVNVLIEARSALLDSGLSKAVSQTHMESGGVELF